MKGDLREFHDGSICFVLAADKSFVTILIDGIRETWCVQSFLEITLPVKCDLTQQHTQTERPNATR
jgi:hypothetical protein